MKAKFVEKVWGHEIWMANNDTEDYCGKILRINKGHTSSMHYHMDKHETFYIVEGILQIILINTELGKEYKKFVHKGCTFEIDRGQPHQLVAYDGDVELIEISTFHRDEDSYRMWR